MLQVLKVAAASGEIHAPGAAATGPQAVCEGQTSMQTEISSSPLESAAGPAFEAINSPVVGWTTVFHRGLRNGQLRDRTE